MAQQEINNGDSGLVSRTKINENDEELYTSQNKQKVSAADTTEGYLDDKTAEGTNIALNILNPGANEQIEISTEVIKSGATQSAAGALENEMWKTLGHTTLPDNVTMVGIEVFLTEYQTVYDSFTIKPVDSIALEQNTMVKGLVSSGVWSKEDVIYVFAAHTNDNSEALVNWKNPGTNDATIIGGLTFTAFEGFKGNGIDGYLNSNFNPFANGVNYIQDSASISYYVRQGVSENTYDTSAYDGTYLTRVASTELFASKDLMALNGADSIGLANNGIGTYTFNRSLSNALQVYKDGLLHRTNANISNGVINTNFYILAQNNNGTADAFSTRQHSCMSFGGSLDSAEALAFETYLEAYMDSNGKGVIT